MPIDIDGARLGELRWRILETLDRGQEIGCSEGLIRTTIETLIPNISFLEIRRALDYLEKRNLLMLNRDGPVWFAILDRWGIDIVNYTVPDSDLDPGIARPRKW